VGQGWLAPVKAYKSIKPRRIEMITRRIILTCSLAMLLMAPSVARPQSVDEATRAQDVTQGGILDALDQMRQEQGQGQGQKLEGSWTVTVTPAVPSGAPQPPSFIAHATIARGGAFFGSDRTRPLSKQHGAWAHLGGNDYAFSFTEDLFDTMGVFVGTLTVRVRLSVTGPDNFVGVSNGEQRDAAGNLIFTRCGTVRGERIKVEPLAPQCQSISPPQ
jgi:hypothetical protein